MFRCHYCGQAITGERIRRKLKGGGIREHLYYRCANNHPGPDHPTVRWKAQDLEHAIIDDLATLRFEPELAAWFRSHLSDAITDLTSHQRRQATALAKRQTELATMQDRLLNAYLAGTVEEAIYKAKSNELKSDAKHNEESLAAMGDVDPVRGEIAMAIFDFTQNAADRWRGSNNAIRREILDLVCLNRALGDVNLVTQKRKPFDVFAEGLVLKNSRDGWTAVELFLLGIRHFAFQSADINKLPSSSTPL